jgi:hypothetical protein
MFAQMLRQQLCAFASFRCVCVDPVIMDDALSDFYPLVCYSDGSGLIRLKFRIFKEDGSRVMTLSTYGELRRHKMSIVPQVLFASTGIVQPQINRTTAHGVVDESAPLITVVEEVTQDADGICHMAVRLNHSIACGNEHALRIELRVNYVASDEPDDNANAVAIPVDLSITETVTHRLLSSSTPDLTESPVRLLRNSGFAIHDGESDKDGDLPALWQQQVEHNDRLSRPAALFAPSRFACDFEREAFPLVTTMADARQLLHIHGWRHLGRDGRVLVECMELIRSLPAAQSPPLWYVFTLTMHARCFALECAHEWISLFDYLSV